MNKNLTMEMIYGFNIFFNPKGSGVGNIDLFVSNFPNPIPLRFTNAAAFGSMVTMLQSPFICYWDDPNYEIVILNVSDTNNIKKNT